MTKFKIGDEVRIKSNQGSVFNIGDTGVIKSNDNSIYRNWEVKVNGETEWFDSEELELVEKKPTKNQRITALENEVAELRPLKQEVAELKLIVHELRGKKSIEPSTTNTVEDIIEFEGLKYRKVERKARKADYVSVSFANGKCFKPNKIYGPVFEDNGLRVKADPSSGGEYEITLVYNDFYDRTPETVDVYELIKEGLNPQIPMVDETIEPLTPNQQRAEIIEKAKKFVEVNSNKEHFHVPYCDGSGLTSVIFGSSDALEFVVNENKRTVVALIKSFSTRHEVYHRGITKCNPNDVFNEHIGKAIALGRALGLDVSEFEQAVQPERAPEQIAMYGDKKVTFKDNDHGHCDSDYGTVHYSSTAAKNSRIINDTNAIYEV